MSLPEGTVTFLFTDVVGSSRLWELHPSEMRAALARLDALVQEEVEAHHGLLVRPRGEGDSHFAVFSQAVDAVLAACSLQIRLCREPWPEAAPIAARIALNTGDADLREGDYYGPSVNRCARLRSMAQGGQVLLSGTTWEMVQDRLPEGMGARDLGEHALRDLPRPQRVLQLLHPDLPEDFAPLANGADLHNLPAEVNRLVGREADLEHVLRLLGESRLVTLTGAGGTGKTRLAVRVAARSLENYPHGVWLVDLAPLSEPALVAQSVASVLSVREEGTRPVSETLATRLKHRSLLLVLDNCEHLLVPCAHLADSLLKSCPGLRVLATSREALGLGGEALYPLRPLPVPDPRRRLTPEAVEGCPAVQLFTERARAATPSFALDAGNAAAVAQVCWKLDGLPLALELAAARVRALPVQEIAGRLDDALHLLRGGDRTAQPRQQTLRALMDWSHDLLSEGERTLFRRLAVFAGGWTLQAAEAVCTGEGVEAREIVDLLDGLVGKSLVLFEASEGRYRMLETIRQYAFGWLRGSGEVDRTQGRLATYLLDLSAGRTPLNPILFRVERGNAMAALDWAESSTEHLDLALCLATAMAALWWGLGQISVGLSHLVRLLELARSGPGGDARLAALYWASMLARLQPDLPLARSLAEECLTVAREIGGPAHVGAALDALSAAAYEQEDDQAARLLAQELLVQAQRSGKPANVAQALGRIGLTAADAEEKIRLLQRAARDLRATGAVGELAVVLCHLGHALLALGETRPAQAAFRESLELRRGYARVGDYWGLAPTLEGLAAVALRVGQHARAARLFGAAEALRQSHGSPLLPRESHRHQGYLAELWKALPGLILQAAWEDGRAMAPDQALQDASRPLE